MDVAALLLVATLFGAGYVLYRFSSG